MKKITRILLGLSISALLASCGCAEQTPTSSATGLSSSQQPSASQSQTSEPSQSQTSEPSQSQSSQSSQTSDTQPITTYSITFNSNGGSNVAAQTVNAGEKFVNPTAPTKDGYTFGGWYTDNETFQNAFDFDAVPNANVTVYAKWTENAPVGDVISIQIGNAVAINMIENPNPYMVLGLRAEYELATPVDLQAGDQIVFKVNGIAITERIGPDEGANATINEAGVISVTKAVEASQIYFKIWEDGYSFYVEGPEESEVEYKLRHGQGSLYQNEDLVLTPDAPEGWDKQYKVKVELLEGEHVKVIDPQNAAISYSYGQIEAGCSDLFNQSGEDAVVKADGYYVFYIKMKANEAGEVEASIWAEFQQKINFQLSKLSMVVEDALDPTQYVEYTFEKVDDDNVPLQGKAVVNAKAGDKLRFFIQGESEGDKSPFNPFGLNADPAVGNNIGYLNLDGSFDIITGGEALEVYFKVVEEDVFRVYVTGYEEPKDPAEELGDYYVVGDMTGWDVGFTNYRLYDMGEDEKISGHTQYESNPIHFGKGAKVKVASSDKKHWFPEAAGSEYVIEEEGNYKIYFVAEGGVERPGWTNGFFCIVSTDQPVGDVYSVQIGNEDPIALVKNEDAAPVKDLIAEYKLPTSVIVAADQPFAFQINGEAPLFEFHADDGSNSKESEGQLLFANACENTMIYFKVWADGGYSFYVTGKNVDPETEHYTVQIGNEAAAAMVINEDAYQILGLVAEYKLAAPVSLKAGEQIVFAFGENALTNIGGDEGSNSYINNAGILCVHNDAEEAQVYLKVWEDGGYSFYVEGYKEAKQGVFFETKGAGEEAEYIDYLMDEDEKAYSKDYMYSYSTSMTATAGDTVRIHVYMEYQGQTQEMIYDGASQQMPLTPASADTFEQDAQGNIKFKTSGLVKIVLGLKYNYETHEESIEILAVPVTLYEEEFSITYDTGTGKSVYVLGDFNGWNINEETAAMVWNEGNVWSTTLELQAGVYEYKFVIAETEDPANIDWNKLNGDNRVLVVGEEPEPETRVFAIQIGNETAINLVPNEDSYATEGLEAEYKLPEAKDLVAGTPIVFKVDGEAIAERIGADKGSNSEVSQAGVISVLQDAEGAQIYFKVWADGGFSYYVEGYEAEPDTNVGAYLTGKIRGENHWYGSPDVAYDEDANVEIPAVEDEQNTNILEHVPLLAGDEIKVVTRAEATDDWTWHGGQYGVNVEIHETGNYTIYLSKNGQVYAKNEKEAPQGDLVVLQNGKPIDIANVKEEGDKQNKAVYKIKLDVDDEIVILDDGDALQFGDDVDVRSFEATIAGQHTFYVNTENKVYVVPPQPEPAEGALTVEQNGKPIDIANVKKEDDKENRAVYKINLAIDDVVVIKNDGEALPLGDSEAKSFTATIAGEHTFYVNNQNKVYVVEPQPEPVGAAYKVDYGTPGADDWLHADMVKSEEAPEGWAEQYEVEVELGEGQAFYIKIDNDYLKYDALEQDCKALFDCVGDNRDAVAKEAGTYTFYLKFKEGGRSLWVSKKGEEPEEPVVLDFQSTDIYTCAVNEGKTVITYESVDDNSYKNVNAGIAELVSEGDDTLTFDVKNNGAESVQLNCRIGTWADGATNLVAMVEYDGYDYWGADDKNAQYNIGAGETRTLVFKFDAEASITDFMMFVNSAWAQETKTHKNGNIEISNVQFSAPESGYNVADFFGTAGDVVLLFDEFGSDDVNVAYQLKASPIVADNAELNFKYDLQAIEVTPSEGEGNAAVIDNGKLIIAKAGKYDIYLKVMKEGGYEIWASEVEVHAAGLFLDTKVGEGEFKEHATVKDQTPEEGYDESYKVIYSASKDEIIRGHYYAHGVGYELEAIFDGSNDIVSIKTAETLENVEEKIQFKAAGLYEIVIGIKLSQEGDPEAIDVWADPAEVADYFIHMGKDAAWRDIDMKEEDLTDEQKEVYSAQYKAIVEFAEGEAFGAKKAGVDSSWYSYDALENDSVKDLFEKVGNDAKIKEAGEYVIYLKIAKTGDVSIYVAKHENLPEVAKFSGSAGNTALVFEQSGSDDVNVKFQVKATATVAAGAELEFKYDGVALEVAPTDDQGNAVSVSNEKLVIAEAGKYNIYLKLMKAGGYEVWAGAVVEVKESVASGDMSSLAAWDPAPSAYYLHIWKSTDDQHPYATWHTDGEKLVKGEGNNYSITIKSNETYDRVIFSFVQNDVTKQTETMEVTIAPEKEYTITIGELSWGQGESANTITGGITIAEKVAQGE